MVDLPQRRGRGASVGLPVILVTMGVILLLQNLDVLPWSLWSTLWRFWPVLLILAGAEILLGRRSPWLTIGVAIAVMAATLAGVVAMSGGEAWLNPGAAAGSQLRELLPELGRAEGLLSPTGAASIERVEESLDGLDQASVTLKFGAGDLRIIALDAASDQVLDGSFQHAAWTDGLQKQFTRSGSRGSYTLSTRSHGFRWPPFAEPAGERWDIRLTPRIPIDLRVQAGASQNDLDLSDLSIRQLRLELGASTALVRLPKAGRTAALVKAGAADVTIEVPSGVAARIKTRSSVASLKVDRERFPRTGAYYESPDFAGAANRVDLEVESGIASITIR